MKKIGKISVVVLPIIILIFFVYKELNKEEISYGVASDSPIATQIGLEVMENGGNAVDAAVAVSYALGVTKPFTSGIGGGGTMLVHPAGKEPIAYDYQVTASEYGDIPGDGIGIPGFIAGMEMAHENHGELEMGELIDPSIQLAEEGVRVKKELHHVLKSNTGLLPVESLPHFYPDEEPIQEGEFLVQEDLAQTLRLIQKEGSDFFYQGELGKEIDKEIYGISHKDIQSYESVKREPIKGTFDGYDVYSVGPPTGGISLVQSLQIAEHMNIEKTKGNSIDFIQMLGEINRKTYDDRVENIGDPKFAKNPANEMLSKERTKTLSEDISLGGLSERYQAELDSRINKSENGNTTHFVVVDKNGTMVSVTNTLSSYFGSGKYVQGFFLNDELENFSSGSSPNQFEPGKRPFSSIAPTILSKDENPIIGIGAAGGRRITMLTAEVLVRILKFDEEPQNAISAPRFYVETDSNTAELEKGMESREEIAEELDDLGYDIELDNSQSHFGSVQTLMVDYEKKQVKGGSDPRRYGKWDSKIPKK